MYQCSYSGNDAGDYWIYILLATSLAAYDTLLEPQHCSLSTNHIIRRLPIVVGFPTKHSNRLNGLHSVHSPRFSVYQSKPGLFQTSHTLPQGRMCPISPSLVHETANNCHGCHTLVQPLDSCGKTMISIPRYTTRSHRRGGTHRRLAFSIEGWPYSHPSAGFN